MGEVRVLVIAAGVLAAFGGAGQARAEGAAQGFALRSSFDLASARAVPSLAGPAGVTAYPNELPRIVADDATPPPRIQWRPSPNALVRIVPAKVRYRLEF